MFYIQCLMSVHNYYVWCNTVLSQRPTALQTKKPKTKHIVNAKLIRLEHRKQSSSFLHSCYLQTVKFISTQLLLANSQIHFYTVVTYKQSNSFLHSSYLQTVKFISTQLLLANSQIHFYTVVTYQQSKSFHRDLPLLPLIV